MPDVALAIENYPIFSKVFAKRHYEDMLLHVAPHLRSVLLEALRHACTDHLALLILLLTR